MIKLNIIIVIFSFILFVSQVKGSEEEFDQSLVNKYIDFYSNRQFTLNDVYLECLVLGNQSMTVCQTIENRLFCPNIKQCLIQLAQSEADGYIVNVPAGVYSGSDCPGVITTFPPKEIRIASVSGLATFRCQSQFLSVTFSETTILILDGLVIDGSNGNQAGCMMVTDKSDNSNSEIHILNSVVKKCVSNDGGFLNAPNIGTIFTFNSIYTKNKASTGLGGVFFAQNSQIIMYNTSFFSNYAQLNGGASYSQNVWVTDSLFTDNVVNQFGGCLYTTAVTFINASAFLHNNATYGGGATYAVNGPTYIYQSNFQNNSAISYAGAVYGVNITIFDSNFTDNSVSSTIGYGGVIRTNSVYYTNPIYLFIENSIFENNSGANGPVIYNEWSHIIITNSAINYNRGMVGGVIYTMNNEFTEQNITIHKSTVSNNYVSQYGGVAFLQQRFDQPVYLDFMDSLFDRNGAGKLAGGIYFDNPPAGFIGGVFTNSMSSEVNSTTFYSESIADINIVDFIYELPQYTVPVYDEPSQSFWKAYGAQGNCTNGVATINQDGVVLTCKSF